MKHLNYSLLVCAVGAMMLCSCNTRQAAINNLRNFNTELYNKKLLKHSYNQEEMAEIGRLQGECMNSFKNAMSDKIEGAANLLKGLWDGLSGK